jgi:hypothetical protein
MGVRLVDNTAKIKVELQWRCANGCNNAAFFWAEESRDMAPEDTGFLKSGIGVTELATANKLSATIRSIAPYSGHVNFGTSKQAAQPFWTVGGLLTREKFGYLFKSGFISISRGSSAGGGVIRQALMDFHGPTGRKGGGF